jgi:hypothetical protein
MVPFRTAAVLASLVLAGIGPATAQEHSTNPATRRFEAGPCVQGGRKNTGATVCARTRRFCWVCTPIATPTSPEGANGR